MSIKKLLLGTGNAKKIESYKKFLSDIPCKIVTVKELDLSEPGEIADTLEGNARLKAEYYFNKSGLPTLADDGGFEIPALDNFPGIKTHRFLKAEMNDEEVIAGIIDAMKDLQDDQRAARFKVVLALRLENVTHTSVGQIDGIVPKIPFSKRMPHFPYRSLLYVTKLDKWFYDVTEAEEMLLGYRKAALEGLKEYLR